MLPQAEGGIFDAGGPQYMSYAEMMRAFGEVIGRKPRLIAVPVLTPKLSSYWLYFVTSVPATTAMSLVEGLAHDYIGEDHEMRELVPQRLLSFRESVAVTLAAEKNHDLPARWVEGSIASREALFSVLQQFGRDATSSPIVSCGGCAARSTG